MSNPPRVEAEGGRMSCWTKEELENMLEDVVNELDLSESAIDKHGPRGTSPAELVRLVLEQKDKEIDLLKRGFVDVRELSRTLAQPFNRGR